MPQPMLIKAGQISNLTDARFFSSRQVEWLGLNFDPLAEEALTVDQAKAIIPWLKGPKMIGEFENRDEEEILFAIDELQLNGVQISGAISTGLLASKSVTVMQKVSVSEEAIPLGLPDGQHFDYLILSVEGEYFDEEEINQSLKEFILMACQEYKVILEMNFTRVNIIPITAYFRPAGINLSGSREVATGLKDFNELSEILDEIEVRQ